MGQLGGGCRASQLPSFVLLRCARSTVGRRWLRAGASLPRCIEGQVRARPLSSACLEVMKRWRQWADRPAGCRGGRRCTPGSPRAGKHQNMRPSSASPGGSLSSLRRCRRASRRRPPIPVRGVRRRRRMWTRIRAGGRRVGRRTGRRRRKNRCSSPGTPKATSPTTTPDRADHVLLQHRRLHRNPHRRLAIWLVAWWSGMSQVRPVMVRTATVAPLWLS